MKKIDIDKMDIGGIPLREWIPWLLKLGAICGIISALIVCKNMNIF